MGASLNTRVSNPYHLRLRLPSNTLPIGPAIEGKAAPLIISNALTDVPLSQLTTLPPHPVIEKTDKQTAESLRPGLVFAERYELCNKIGKGGMAEVWQAKDLQNNERIVAIKVPKNDPEYRGTFQKRLIEEGKIHKELKEKYPDSPFPEYLGAGETDPVYIAMGYAHGPTLRTFFNEGNRPLHETIEIMMQLCGLTALHKTGYVHRDPKPENIILTKGKKIAIILDLGLACQIGHQEKAGRTVGTMGYSPPELSGKETGEESSEATPRTDIFSLGVLFNEMMSGGGAWTIDSMTKHGYLFTAVKERFEDTLENLEPSEREKLERQIESLHYLLLNIVSKMTKEDKKDRFKTKGLLSKLKKARKLARKLAPHEKPLTFLEKNYEFAV